ncbi:hypothetical protein [Streptomyces sp. NPDC002467]|uniref:hypothetical protein n=1 Tax=Streptomyces sp. NPDC002467 TaxID=3364647 RepID=UPI0036A24935
MDDQGGDSVSVSVSVWRMDGAALAAGYVTPALAGVKALAGWGAWLSAPGAGAARSAGLWTGLAIGVALFSWWAILRTRLEVGPEEIVAVNPWGTHRLELREVASVRLGMWGAEFQHRDGFQTTAHALRDFAGGTTQNRRFAELQAALRANPDFSPQ